MNHSYLEQCQTATMTGFANLKTKGFFWKA
jgi:hypothetical protein